MRYFINYARKWNSWKKKITISAMFDTSNAGSVDIHQFNKMFEYINQWLNIFKTYDRNASGLIDDQELNQGKYCLLSTERKKNQILIYGLNFSIFTNGIQFFAKFHEAVDKSKQWSKGGVCWRIHCTFCNHSTFDRSVPCTWHAAQRCDNHWFRRFPQCRSNQHKLITFHSTKCPSLRCSRQKKNDITIFKYMHTYSFR